eukprot:gene6625-4745_t
MSSVMLSHPKYFPTPCSSDYAHASNQAGHYTPVYTRTTI